MDILRVGKALGSRGQGLLEYSLAIVLVAIVVVVLVTVLGQSTGNMFSNIVYSV
jgi:Flp pilus assembly pilin Flp